jgi:hypothetical protein
MKVDLVTAENNDILNLICITNKYRNLKKNNVYTVSLLNYDKVSFIRVSGTYYIENFKVENSNLKLKDNIYHRFNSFDIDMFNKTNGLVKCLYNKTYFNLNLNQIYNSKIYQPGKYDTDNYLIINDIIYPKSIFKTLTLQEARIQKINEII